MKKKLCIKRRIKRVMNRILSGDKHIWGWVTLDFSQPFPPVSSHCAMR